MVKIVKGYPPTRCDLCSEVLRDQSKPVAYDARTKYRAWAWMCSSCFYKSAHGLGTGRGQKYELNAQVNEWIKIDG